MSKYVGSLTGRRGSTLHIIADTAPRIGPGASIARWDRRSQDAARETPHSEADSPFGD